MTFTVNLNRAGARDFADYARKLSFVKVEEPQVDPLVKGKSPYNPEYVAMIKRSQREARNGNFKTIKEEDLWK